jgi:hypothetical protein
MATACLFAVVFLVQFDALVAISGPAPTAPQYCDALKTHCPINPISASDPQKKCLLNTCSIQGGPGVFGTCMYGSEQCNTNADCTCVCEGATSTKCENYASPTTAICDSKVACVPLTASGAVQACVHDICIKSSSGSPQGHCQHDTSAPCTSNSDTSCVCSSTYAPCVAVATMSPTPQPTAMCPSTVKCPDPTQACVKQDCVMSTPGALWGHVVACARRAKHTALARRHRYRLLRFQRRVPTRCVLSSARSACTRRVCEPTMAGWDWDTAVSAEVSAMSTRIARACASTTLTISRLVASIDRRRPNT